MPRRKKLDATPILEAFLAEIDFRIARSLKDAIHDIERRLERIEKKLTGSGTRGASPKAYKTCRRPDCSGRVVAHGLCSRHYQQWRYHRNKDDDGVGVKKPAVKKTGNKKKA